MHFITTWNWNFQYYGYRCYIEIKRNQSFFLSTSLLYKAFINHYWSIIPSTKIFQTWLNNEIDLIIGKVDKFSSQSKIEKVNKHEDTGDWLNELEQ